MTVHNAPPLTRHPWLAKLWPGFDSLRLRLLSGTLIWVLLSLLVAGWGLRTLFQEHISQQLQTQLVQQLDRLSASVNALPNGAVEVNPLPSDPRLQQPLSGLYWQIDKLAASGQETAQINVQSSRSLWDQTLDFKQFEPTRSAPEKNAAQSSVQYGMLPAQHQGAPLVVVTRTLQLPEAYAPPLRLMVAADSSLLAEPLQRFTKMLVMALSALGAGLLIAVVIQLRLALAPLAAIRQQLAAVSQGDAPELGGQHPAELMPLVQEFNHVLRINAEMVQRARTQAGNLAHSVNTPLTIMGHAAARENGPLAELVREQVASASRQVDHHLARARAAAAAASAQNHTGLRTPLAPALQSLISTMGKLHAARGIAFSYTFMPKAEEQLWVFKGEAQDLMEMLGNLLDNAGKWAHTQVLLTVQAGQNGKRIVLTVDDDGPGIAVEQREQIFGRGLRLDEQRPGAGLGLSIVRELVQTYGGQIEARTAPLGGLRMLLDLPAARH